MARQAVQQSPTAIVRRTCYVPWVFDALSTPRLLVEEYVDNACQLIALDRVRSMGLSTKKVAQSVMEVFADQIFQSGIVQADGHPANILVRQHPDWVQDQRTAHGWWHRWWKRACGLGGVWGASVPHQVVLIDHGLYVHLSPEFRREYAELWRAIWEVDLNTLERITQKWGMDPSSSDLFASATLMRPWSRSQQRGGPPPPIRAKESDRSELERNQVMKEKLKTFLVNVELVPKELIFLGRCMRIVQNNNQSLGSPVNRLNILARHAADALIQERTSSLWRVFFPPPESGVVGSEAGPSGERRTFQARLQEWTRDRRAYVTFHVVLLVVDVAYHISQLAHWVRWLWSAPFLPTTPGLSQDGTTHKGGFEDDLELQMRQLAHEEFGVELDEDSFV